MATIKTKDINDMFSNLDEKVKIVFRHQMLMNVYQSIPREYDTGFFMSEIEIHTLGFIQQSPGITAKQICKLTYRTKGTISAMLSKLEKDGFIEQHINPKNMRERNLYLTDSGELACKKHTAFDRKTTADYLMAISEYCTPEEINGYFKVTHLRSEYFEKVILKEKARYTEVSKKNK
jgi:DNA-binding MarR family transcriptional regulator